MDTKAQVVACVDVSAFVYLASGGRFRCVTARSERARDEGWLAYDVVAAHSHITYSEARSDGWTHDEAREIAGREWTPGDPLDAGEGIEFDQPSKRRRRTRPIVEMFVGESVDAVDPALDEQSWLVLTPRAAFVVEGGSVTEVQHVADERFERAIDLAPWPAPSEGIRVGARLCGADSVEAILRVSSRTTPRTVELTDQSPADSYFVPVLEAKGVLGYCIDLDPDRPIRVVKWMSDGSGPVEVPGPIWQIEIYVLSQRAHYWRFLEHPGAARLGRPLAIVPAAGHRIDALVAEAAALTPRQRVKWAERLR